MEPVESPCIYSEATLLSGTTVTLGPCRSVLELKVRACQQFSIANLIISMKPGCVNYKWITYLDVRPT